MSDLHRFEITLHEDDQAKVTMDGEALQGVVSVSVRGCCGRRPLVTLELRAQAVKAMVRARQRAQLTEGLEA